MVIRRIGLATGGGDCPGLNAAIRAVVKTAIRCHGWQVVGVTNGFDGLIWPERCVEMTVDSVRGLLPLGGTILGTTNRGNPFRYPSRKMDWRRNATSPNVPEEPSLDLDALVVVGGEGTLGIARDFSRLGIPIVGLPKTIDHDVSRDGNHHWI